MVLSLIGSLTACGEKPSQSRTYTATEEGVLRATATGPIAVILAAGWRPYGEATSGGTTSASFFRCSPATPQDKCPLTEAADAPVIRRGFNGIPNDRLDNWGRKMSVSYNGSPPSAPKYGCTTKNPDPMTADGLWLLINTIRLDYPGFRGAINTPDGVSWVCYVVAGTS